MLINNLIPVIHVKQGVNSVLMDSLAYHLFVQAVNIYKIINASNVQKRVLHAHLQPNAHCVQKIIISTTINVAPLVQMVLLAPVTVNVPLAQLDVQHVSTQIVVQHVNLNIILIKIHVRLIVHRAIMLILDNVWHVILHVNNVVMP